MASDESHAVQTELWDAAIPVQLRLADSEVSSLEQPPTLYTLVPRQSYLHSLVPQALRLLQHLLPPGDDAPWFEAGALPLRWGVPAGVLRDLVAGPQGELPWRLTIHFRSYPAKMLATYGGEAALRGALLGSLKEAAVVTRGSAQRVMEMAAGAQEDLFRQALASCLPRYRAILAALQLAPAAQRGGPPRVPLRLYVRTDAVGGYLASYEDIVSTSRPVAALGPDGKPVSLRQALLPLLEEVLRRGGGGAGGSAAAAAAAGQSQPGTPVAAAAEQSSEVSRGGDSAAASEDAEAPAAAASEASEGGAAGDGQAAAGGSGAGPSAAAAAAAAAATPAPASPGATAAAAAAGSSLATEAAERLEQAAAAGRVLIGGTSPPLEAPLAWLHAQLHAPDYFLYCVVHMPLPNYS